MIKWAANIIKLNPELRYRIIIQYNKERIWQKQNFLTFINLLPDIASLSGIDSK